MAKDKINLVKEKKNNLVKDDKRNNLVKDEKKNISVTDDKMINDILGNIGKKTKNVAKKELINNFIDKKNKYDKKNNNNEDDENIKKTFTENLTKEEINEKLEDYKLVDDISKVPLNTHLRYFINKNGTMLFRMGGNLKRNLDLPKFVILKNALGTEWTVQVEGTIFYKKMSIIEIKEEYEQIIDDLNKKIKKLKQTIKELEK
jgi:hypothetical protein